MYVKDNMTRNPYTVTSEKSISEVLDIMSASKVHRLPVVDKAGKLIGLLTESLIATNNQNSYSSLSVFELNYLLNKITVKEVMVKEPVSIGPDALLEEAATLMHRYNIGCLPVVDKDNLLVGIITKNDIFVALIDLLGYNKKGSRYVINVPDDIPGVLENIAKLFSENNLSISNIAVYHTERGIEIVFITYDQSDITDKLKAAGYNVTEYTKLHQEA